MAMGITRVADQYGFAVEAQAHREALAAYAEDAAALAERSKGFGVTAGMNDPRRMQRQAVDGGLTAVDDPSDAGRAVSDVGPQLTTAGQHHTHEDGGPYVPYDHALMGGWDDMTPLDREELEVRYNNPDKWRHRFDGGSTPGPFGGLLDSTVGDLAESKGRHQAGYGADDAALSEHLHGGPDTGHGHQSGQDWDDGFGGWQTNMDDGTWGADEPPEFEHNAPRGAFGDSDELEPADLGYGDEAYDDGGEPHHRHEDLGFSSDDVDRLKGGGDESAWGGGWESGLDRPFTGGINDLGPDSFGSDPDHMESEYDLNAHDDHEIDPFESKHPTRRWSEDPHDGFPYPPDR